MVDHGIGIPRVDRARIFERFYKADRARVRGGGTGLGLAIARHVWRVTVAGSRSSPKEGRGSTFTFAIPSPAAAVDPARLQPAPCPRSPPMDRLHVATLNIRNLADRWEERLPLLLADFAALQPDVIGLQEVVYPLQQDRLLGAAGAGRYAAVRGWAGRPEYGNSVLVREPLVPGASDRLDLGLNRAAHRVCVALPGGSRLVFAVTHLHHEVADATQRLEQVEALLPWLDRSPEHEAMVVVGDFNASPSEPAYGRMAGAGFRSAHARPTGPSRT